jgi:hypothetical protein
VKQTSFFKSSEKAYGGSLLTKRKGRAHGRPLATKNTMHLVLKSSKAKGPWSFQRHTKTIKHIIEKFAGKYGIKLISVANVGNHLHLHVQLGNRFTYAPFIRAVTGSIALKIKGRGGSNKFWDQRPFSRIVIGRQGYLRMEDYIKINKLEGETGSRVLAELIVRGPRWAETETG